MYRLPPRSTRTDPPFPYTQLFRSRGLDLGARLTLGPGELKSGGHRRDSILADALEALIAALYLDGGFDACRQVVLPWFEPLLAALPPLHQVGKDAKTRLQEWLQARQLPLPVYALLAETGDDHDKTRSDEHTSELQSLMRISYAVFCLKKKK